MIIPAIAIFLAGYLTRWLVETIWPPISRKPTPRADITRAVAREREPACASRRKRSPRSTAR